MNTLSICSRSCLSGFGGMWRAHLASRGAAWEVVAALLPKHGGATTRRRLVEEQQTLLQISSGEQHAKEVDVGRAKDLKWKPHDLRGAKAR